MAATSGQADRPLLVSREGHVVTWTINRPESRNPITDQDMVDALCDAVHAANMDGTVRALVLTGAGSAFSAGGDIKAMAAREGMFDGTPPQLRDGYRRGVQRLTRAVYHCEAPLVAAVNGPAVGAGCDLALMCDVRIASERAFFAESFVKLGIIPGDGGAWLLPRVVGVARAAEMTLTGDRVSATQALEWGLVSQVTAPDDLLTTAQELAQRIAANPPQAVRAAKHLLRASQHQRLDDMLDSAAALQALVHTTSDHDEAVRAMLERRPGDFHGH